ncbi:hypothetical protein [Tsukamurella paurometabola]|uniref:Uncharacterized protein n=1 Tax=Tsukamurella paurometabola TaxID=2061 RepID=A0A3P8MAV5_TSUPA|nr:hypothetical protein [Tsukamurella paurometabola]UEA81633.1 hypothetical protein LK411_14645 [Tsukamurella paurometabola]VDR38640.1 Uncharacterised protein [Tsukamurella paurometabola]
MRTAAIVLSVFATLLLVKWYATRAVSVGDLPSSGVVVDHTTPDPYVYGTVMQTDLVSASPEQARKMLGYPDLGPGVEPQIIAQDATTDLNAPLIITAMCWQPEGAKQLVFETANPAQISADDLSGLKSAVFQYRQDHIKAVTGCDSRFVGIPVKHLK